VLGRAAVGVVVAVHLAFCAAHASASCAGPGSASTAVGVAVVGLAQLHAAATGTSRLQHGTRLQLTGADTADVGHVCAKKAVESREDAGGVLVSVGPPLPLSCVPVATTDCCCGFVPMVTEASPARCMILRC
jgi:hypothetical protein